MAKRKRKTLPKDFEDLLQQGSLEELKAVFDACELDATGGYGKHTAIGFVECPDGLVRWLVAQGLDVDAPDAYGYTPLHERVSTGWTNQVPLLLELGAGIDRPDRHGQTPLHAAAKRHQPEAVRMLVERGADVHARCDMDDTPLKLALRATRNADIAAMSEVAALLLDAGATVTPDMRQEVERIGRDFEFHRASFNPDDLAAADAGLATLYRLFDAAPAAQRRMHDGVSAITVEAVRWQDRHQALWELLVPSQGAAATVQGEVIRISGRIAREILDNGAANWDADFRKMLDAFAAHVGGGTPLPEAKQAEARALAASLRSGGGDGAQLERLAELAVDWVIANPGPMPLAAPAYSR